MLLQGERALRPIALVLASAVFFMILGPAVGAVVFLPDIGLVAAFMLAHGVGTIPALMAGTLNAAVILSPVVRSPSMRGRLLHAFIGGLIGFLATALFLDYPDWVLMRRSSGWHKFWYTYNRDYVELSMAGLLAGGVCSFIFNPWAQRQYAT